MKKALRIISILMVAIVFISINSLALAKDNQPTRNDIPYILNSSKISEDTKDWLRWFDSLPSEEQQYVNYRPSELDGYSYEKNNKYFNPLDLHFIFPDEADIFTSGSITTFGVNPQDPGNKILPLSGYELKYNPQYWNSYKDRANCYTYALNYLAGKNPATQQPGYASGRKFTSCTGKAILEAAKRDVPYLSGVKGLRSASENQKPGKNEYKVALVIATEIGKKKDYHWYRQDSDGYWSHKRGSTAITRTDASGKQIINPRKANRNYGSLNYNIFYGYFFIKH
ncbi:hypothetical protein [Kallipyga massiliensis]|uniref:hypothetical protein n=1 Tax=Kallipyga massiliensis TaxID=1472764 RepID=UPI0004ADCE91|nr:hypothetical protein [Kallipyga massiliensis]